MSDFDRQVRERKEHDRLHLHHAVRSLTGTVNREKGYDSGMKLNAEEDAALYDLCRFYDLPDKELSSELTGIDEKLNYLLESRGVMRRRVTLDGDWWRHMAGPVLVRKKTDGAVVNLMQDRLGRYYYQDRANRSEDQDQRQKCL